MTAVPTRSASPVRSTQPAAPGGGRRHRLPLVELGLAAGGLVAYLVVRSATAGRTADAVAHAGDVLALEARLGLDVEHGVQAATYRSAPWLGDALTWFYVWGYFPALLAAATWLYLRRPDAFGRLRVALVASGVVGLAVYALYPCAPPWLTDDRFADTVAGASLEAVARPGLVMNELGALPSFHVGWLALVAVVVAVTTTSPAVRAACVLYPALMAAAVVVTGNHWVLDIPAGLALTAVGLLAARWWSAARHHSPPGPAG